MIKALDPAMPTEKLRLAKMLKALGNPIRFQIVETLAERQVCITAEIVQTTPLAQSTVSQHLKVLKDAGLILGLRKAVFKTTLRQWFKEE